MILKVYFGIVLCFVFAVLNAQQADSSARWNIFTDSIEFTASRLTDIQSRSSFNYHYLNDLQIKERQLQVSLKESLDLLPGIFSNNAENYAQDLRISIRGFGARAAFGIRGIKMLIDGIPETTPDGITQVDNLDMSSIQSIKVINTGMSALYGNASAGVIELFTDDVPDTSRVQFSTAIGAYGLRKAVLGIGHRFSTRFGLHATLSGMEAQGYRSNSSTRHLHLNTKLEFKTSDRSRIQLLLNHANSPEGNDPGGLTEAETMIDRRSATSQNVNFMAGESVIQSKVAVNFLWKQDPYNYFRARSYFFLRDFANSLPFRNGGVVEIDRSYFGAGIEYSRSKKLLQGELIILSGIDFDEQRDDRFRYNNLNGTKGENVFHQLEFFRSFGVYNRILMEFASFVQFNLANRIDINQIGLRDYFNSQPFMMHLRQISWSPSVGMVTPLNKQSNVFINFSKSFDMPSLIELSNNPISDSGFNPDLTPQYAHHLEFGYRYFIGESFSTNVTFFHIWTLDEITPYELPEFPQRIFYRNAGDGRRYGIELQLSKKIFDSFFIWASGSIGQYELQNAALQHLELAGMPSTTSSILATYDWKKHTLSLSMRHNGAVYVDDANTLKLNAHNIFNIQYSRDFSVVKSNFKLQIGWQNIFNQQYFSNIRINAAGGRYFEPAIGSNIYFRFQVLL